MPGQQFDDTATELFLGHLLRTGVIIAGSVVLAGAAIYLIRHGLQSPDYHAFRGEPADLRTIRGIVGEMVHLRGRGVIQFGLLLLIATPIARVAFSVYAFARERDFRYVLITLLVLGLLLFSLLG